MATLQDTLTKLERDLKKLDAQTRLAFLLGGLLATADELRIHAAQVVVIVKKAIEQRAAVLARMREGDRILFGPDGAPLVPGAARVPDEVPTVKLGPQGDGVVERGCGCTDWSDGFPRPPRDDQHQPGCPRYAAHLADNTTKATEDGAEAPLCAFCGRTEAEGRHSAETHPNTWHDFRSVTDAVRCQPAPGRPPA